MTQSASYPPLGAIPRAENDFDKLLASLEPAAVNGESEWSNVAHLSAAVSLKRIADALDSPSDKGSVLWWLETIASAANASVGR